MTTDSRPSRARRRAARAGLLLLAASVAGCSSCSDEQPDASKATPAASAALSPVPAPDGIVAELFLKRPDDTWSALRGLAGGRAAILPASFQMLVGTLAGLPAAAASTIDANVAAVGVLVDAGGGTEPSLVLGVHVRSGGELVARVADGSKASYDKSAGEQGLTVLTAKAGKAPEDIHLGVVGNYLLISRDAAALKKAGPYVARTLPDRVEKQPAPLTLRADEKALSGPIAKGVRGYWKRTRAKLDALREKARDEKGRDADFADPAAAMKGLDAGVEALVKVLESSERAVVELEPTSTRLELRAELDPKDSGAAKDLISGMEVGDLAPLLALPASTAVAITSRSKALDEPGAATSAALSALFGDRLPDADEKRLNETLASLAKGRGSHLSYGLLAGKLTSIVLRGKVRDEKAFGEGADGAFQLLKLKAFSEPLGQYAGDFTTKPSTVTVPGLDGKVKRVEVTVKPPTPTSDAAPTQGGKPAKKPEPKKFEFLWQVSDGMVYGAVSTEAEAALLSVAGKQQGQKTLADVAPVAAAAKRVGSDAGFALLLDPLKIGLSALGLPASSPMLVAVGRRDGLGWVRVDASKQAVQLIIRQLSARAAKR